MTLDVIELETAPHPTASIIILHGLGADGEDFAPLAQQLDLGAAGPVRFVFPHGPVRPVTVNGGYEMRAWYDIFGSELGLNAPHEPHPREDEAGLRASQKLVEGLIAKERTRGIAASRIVLAGFSQGCAMTFMAGLRHPERLAGLLGMSGYVPLAGLTATERHPSNADVPIFQAHGSADSVIPMPRATASRDVLMALGYPVEWHAYPMAHSVCQQELADINRWLLTALRA
jgi:phospholipase/carboxylesterase